MPLSITSTLIGAATQPRPVQVNVTGMTIGEDFTVTASSGAWSRVVQGGSGTADATQLVLVDVATPLNAEITYTVVHDGSTIATSSTVTVAYDAGDALLCSLDGATVAGIFWLDNGDPREQAPRAAFYLPAGRSRAIMHYDVAGDESGKILAETSGVDTVALRELVRAGAPVLLRTDVGIRDLDPVEILGISAAPRSLIGASGGLRRWDLAYTLTADEEDAPLVLATVEDFNTIWSGQYVDDFNTEWSGQYVDDFNAFDWAGEAS